MRIALLSRTAITSKKDGKEYVKYSGFSKKGEAVEAFITREADTLSPGYAPDEEALAAVFDTLPQAEVEFNQRGRIEAIEEVED